MKNDLISRSEALRAIDETTDIDGAYHAIENLAAAEADLVHCGECSKQGTVACAFDGLYFKLGKDTDFCSKGTRRTDHGTDH